MRKILKKPLLVAANASSRSHRVNGLKKSGTATASFLSQLCSPSSLPWPTHEQRGAASVVSSGQASSSSSLVSGARPPCRCGPARRAYGLLPGRVELVELPASTCKRDTTARADRSSWVAYVAWQSSFYASLRHRWFRDRDIL